MPDNLTPQQRSYAMSRVRGRDTKLELTVRRELEARGLAYRTHAAELAGTPDVVFDEARVVLFIDGDFWHGYRFPAWKATLSPFWQEKISKTRERDHRNSRALRRRGWTVIRLWQHQVKADVAGHVDRITRLVCKPPSC